MAETMSWEELRTRFPKAAQQATTKPAPDQRPKPATGDYYAHLIRARAAQATEQARETAVNDAPKTPRKPDLLDLMRGA